MRTTALVLFCAAALPGLAQERGELHAIARNADNAVVLRWAPGTKAAWQARNRYGYRVERFTLGPGMRPGQAPVKLSPDSLRPLPLTAMKQRYAADHAWMPAVAQALYGTGFGEKPVGGDLKAGIDRAREEDLRYSVSLLAADLDADAADALALRWVDGTIVPNTHYLYRVIALDPAGRDTAYVALDRLEGNDPLPHAPPITTHGDEQRVRIAWSPAEASAAFSGWWVERSTDGGEWTRLNKRPYVPTSEKAESPMSKCSFDDTTITRNYVPYHYRLIGISSFAENSLPSDAVIGMGRDRTAPPSPVIGRLEERAGQFTVRWEMPSTPADLDGFRVEKAITTDGPFIPLHEDVLPSRSRFITDTTAHLSLENHYRVVALDTARNASVSLVAYGVLTDTLAPAVPRDLSGMIEPDGVVTLHWSASRESDVIGYRVFFANAPDHAFSCLTGYPVSTSSYSDTIDMHTLTRDIYYQVSALDRNHNESTKSPLLRLRRPDLIAPVAPAFSGYAVTDSSVALRFIPSSSPDVAFTCIERSAQGSESWDLSDTLRPPASGNYTDLRLTAATSYRYRILAVDSAGNRSAASSSLNVRVPPRVRRLAPSAITAVRDEASVRLSWNTMQEQGIQRYVLYRSKDDGAWYAVASTEASASSYVDDRTIGKGQYRYRMTAVFGDGFESGPGPSSAVIDLR